MLFIPTILSKIIIVLWLYLIQIKAARILAVFPVPSISHQVVFRPLTQELVSQGHEVTVITTDLAFSEGQAPENLIEIDVQNLSYNVWREKFFALSVGKSDDIFSHIEIGFKLVTEVFQEQMKSDEIQNIILNKKEYYDLLLLEAVPSFLALSHIFKVPVIQISSYSGLSYHRKAMGITKNYLLYPTLFHQRLYNMTSYEEVEELHRQWWFEEYIDNTYIEVEQQVTIFGTEIPPLSELYKNIHFLLINVHPIWTNNQPVPSNVVYIGGIHKPIKKVLPKEIQKYLESSSSGVIYFSLGTNVQPSQLPAEKIQLLINVFTKLPYDVLWKWDEDIISLSIPKNIKIFKWLPQSKILKHPSVKLFITQGGLQSTDEAITAGVPLIGIPMIADQWYNIEMYVHQGIGVKLDMATMTEDEFHLAIERVITDIRFRENIKHLQTLMDDQLHSPLERAVWWTEHILRHGSADHLRSAGANLSWADYLELDTVFPVLVLVTFIGILLGVITIKIWRLVNRKCVYYFKIKVKDL